MNSNNTFEYFLLNQGWFSVRAAYLKKGMLIKMFDPDGEPIIYNNSDRWVIYGISEEKVIDVEPYIRLAY